MILDFHNIKIYEIGNFLYGTTDFDIIDAVTGENLNHRCIFYADDEAGFYRYYKHTRSETKGIEYLFDEDGNPIVCEVHRKLRIVPRQGTGARIRRSLDSCDATLDNATISDR